jgi:hypothetical protein
MEQILEIIYVVNNHVNKENKDTQRCEAWNNQVSYQTVDHKEFDHQETVKGVGL